MLFEKVCVIFVVGNIELIPVVKPRALQCAVGDFKTDRADDIIRRIIDLVIEKEEITSVDETMDDEDTSEEDADDEAFSDEKIAELVEAEIEKALAELPDEREDVE